ncbi:ArsR family transcriptional regulator [Desulfurococcaceae archaeon MEX13E-LK6-19]|nr:ArsR family transcriptional regulator [Desulfurococcaceae archaeon MEX13E-LK6-19]
MSMPSGNIGLTEEEVRYFINKIKLRKLYEDDDVVLMTAPNEDELIEIILDLLKEKPMNLREIHTILSGLASEDKIRKALITLMSNGIITINSDGRYMIIGF